LCHNIKNYLLTILQILSALDVFKNPYDLCKRGVKNFWKCNNYLWNCFPRTCKASSQFFSACGIVEGFCLEEIGNSRAIISDAISGCSQVDSSDVFLKVRCQCYKKNFSVTNALGKKLDCLPQLTHSSNSEILLLCQHPTLRMKWGLGY